MYHRDTANIFRIDHRTVSYFALNSTVIYFVLNGTFFTRVRFTADRSSRRRRLRVRRPLLRRIRRTLWLRQQLRQWLRLRRLRFGSWSSVDRTCGHIRTRSSCNQLRQYVQGKRALNVGTCSRTSRYDTGKESSPRRVAHCARPKVTLEYSINELLRKKIAR